MAIKILKGDRSRGYDLADGITLVGGMGVIKSSSDATGETITLISGAGQTIFGLSVESNVAYSTQGYKFDDFNRGGKVSTTLGPCLVELSDDGRGSPFLSTVTYTVDQPVYAGTDGRITNVANGPIIGYVDKTNSDGVLRIRINGI